MSVKDINKVMILTDTLTGNVIAQIPFDDKLIASEYITALMYRQLADEKGIMIKIGIKS